MQLAEKGGRASGTLASLWIDREGKQPSPISPIRRCKLADVTGWNVSARVDNKTNPPEVHVKKAAKMMFKVIIADVDGFSTALKPAGVPSRSAGFYCRVNFGPAPATGMNSPSLLTITEISNLTFLDRRRGARKIPRCLCSPTHGTSAPTYMQAFGTSRVQRNGISGRLDEISHKSALTNRRLKSTVPKNRVRPPACTRPDPPAACFKGDQNSQISRLERLEISTLVPKPLHRALLLIPQTLRQLPLGTATLFSFCIATMSYHNRTPVLLATFLQVCR
ncbi:uncharacterized protein CLUP02_10980 [Colletotrichum lupini]|uniref:Uncharacterized protein n=1 Tax=Colletotrichum lupini TaxID=145971 RepID=A0A9Q8SXR3_9PEZI|nr:uncharacterized protein CLUP02_10980 [Colletotrichum lupini]UQC85482.1 hypothetical protein CLUP02_10980 [Colletotrichum lupini]